MKGESTFTKEQFEGIKKLVKEKTGALGEDQKRIRNKIRKMYNFYISDFTFSKKGFTVEDLEELKQAKQIAVTG